MSPDAQKVAEYLEDRVRRLGVEGVVTYGKLASHFGFPEITDAWRSHPLSQILEELDDDDSYNKRPFRTALIVKRGYVIRGDLVFVEGRHKGKSYPVKGRYSHSLLTFHYFPADKISTSQGTATFQRLRDGALLKGVFSYYSQDSDTVATVACELNPI